MKYSLVLNEVQDKHMKRFIYEWLDYPDYDTFVRSTFDDGISGLLIGYLKTIEDQHEYKQFQYVVNTIIAMETLVQHEEMKW